MSEKGQEAQKHKNEWSQKTDKTSSHSLSREEGELVT